MSSVRNFLRGKPGGGSGSGRGEHRGSLPAIGPGGGMVSSVGSGGAGGMDGMVNIVDGTKPDVVNGWEVEAREQRIRAQIAEESHLYDSQQILTYLKQMRVGTKRNITAVCQLIEYCNSILHERFEADKYAQLQERKLEEATANAKYWQEQNDNAIKDIIKARAEAESAHSKKSEMKEKLSKADSKRNEAVAKVMQQMRAAAAEHLRDKRQSEREMRAKISRLEAEIDTIKRGHRDVLRQSDAIHAAKVKDMADKHNAAQKTMHENQEREIDEIIDAHEAETEILKDKVRELATELISQTDDFRPATDQALRIKLLDLRNRIKNMTASSNLQVRTEVDGASGAAGDGAGGGGSGAAPHQLPRDLDPTGFVARHETRDLQYVLRGLIWNILIDAFFSAPFGFGFLGPDPKRHPGRQQLLDIYRSWSRLYEGQQAYSTLPVFFVVVAVAVVAGPFKLTTTGYAYDAPDDFVIFTSDHNANKLRSAVFQSFLPRIFPEKAAARQQHAGAAQPEQQQTLQQQALPLRPLPPVPQQPHELLGDPLWPGQLQTFQPGGGDALPQYPSLSGASPPLPPPRRPLGGTPDLGVAVWHRQHCDSVIASIRQLLDRVTGNATRSNTLDAVPAIVNLAAELGIEFGVQRAQILLVVPQRNDLVQEGPEYQDCLGSRGGAAAHGSGEDGNKNNKGDRDMKVDLVVSPGMVRIGDGHGDLTFRKALVPCEVFPYV